jgi:hypothetical protein
MVEERKDCALMPVLHRVGKYPGIALAWSNEKAMPSSEAPDRRRHIGKTKHFNPRVYWYWILTSLHDLFHYTASIALPELCPFYNA